MRTWISPRLSRRILLLTTCITAMSFCLLARSSNKHTHFERNANYSHRKLLEEDQVKNTLEMFQVSDFTVVGPSAWPKPSAKLHPNAVPLLEPSFGKHRSDQDVVMAFAAEYGLNTYLSFVTTLRNTGFRGDIVLAVSKLDVQQKGVTEFFSSQEGLVVYVIDLKCFNAEGEEVDSVKGGMRVCQLPGLYQYKHGNVSTTQVDPRPSRTVATTRYELYWLWTIHYKPHSWIMLLDARDAFFQTNPFEHVPREKMESRPDGLLYFFGVSVECVCIYKWLERFIHDTHNHYYYLGKYTSHSDWQISQEFQMDLQCLR